MKSIYTLEKAFSSCNDCETYIPLSFSLPTRKHAWSPMDIWRE